MSPTLQATLDQTLERLKTELGENLYSCCLYGSAVRGNAIEGVSDINLLLVLNESSSASHQAVSRALSGQPKINPFILAKRGFERSVSAFATKFGSIKRNYRVLHGVDPLASITVDEKLERFLCEQAVRNLRLRLVYSFVTRQQHKAYDRFLRNNVTPLFVQLSEALRLTGVTIPTSFESRLPVLEKEFAIDGQVLRDLLALKKSAERFSEDETVAWHERAFGLIDVVLIWIETRWI